MKRRLGLWLPVVAVAAVVSALSHVSRPPRPAAAPDWLLHGAEFLVLGFFLLRAVAGGLRWPPRARHALAALGLAALFGLGDEFHQSFVPDRHSDARDVVADAAGAAVGIALAAAAACVSPASRGRLAGPDRSLEVSLITGPGCTLCEDARQALNRLARRFPLVLHERSVADDPDLHALYGLQIPVILIGGQRVSKGRVDETRLAVSLAARLRSKGRQV